MPNRLTYDAGGTGQPRAQRRAMRAALAEFLTTSGLVGRETRIAVARDIIASRGGVTPTLRGLGYTPAKRGTAEGKAYLAARRAFERAATGQQALSDRYLGRLFGVASGPQQARLLAAQQGRISQHVRLPVGASVQVTVAGHSTYDDRERDDMYAEFDADTMEDLLSDPWEAWDAGKGYLDDIEIDRLDTITIELHGAGGGDDDDTF